MQKSTLRRILSACVVGAVFILIFSSFRIGQESPPEHEDAFHEHGLRIIPHHSEPALQSEEDAIDLKNISREITNARLTLQRIQETVDAAKESLAKFMQEWSGTVPSQDKSSKATPFTHGDKHAKVEARDPRVGEIRPHLNVQTCLDGVDEKSGALPYPCHGKGGNQYWKWTKTSQLSSTGLCLDATDVKPKQRVKLTSCKAGTPGQRFDYPYQGVWYPAGPLVSASTQLCLTPPLPDEPYADVVLDKCDGSCRQLWLVNAPFFNGSTPIRRLSRNPKPVQQGSPTVLCWVMTNPQNHGTKAKAVMETWARHCNTLIFVSTEQVPGATTLLVDLNGEAESRDLLWKKSQFAWMHMYHNYLTNAEWFLRADDDTYIMMDNLRDFLSGYSHNETHFFGRRLIAREDNASFYSGGSGTILSRNTLRVLGEAVDHEEPDTIFSPFNTFADDVEIALSLNRLGIATENTRDEEGRARFITLGLHPERTLTRDANKDHWLWVYDRDSKEGLECCSKHWVGTHYVPPEEMRQLEDLHSVGCEAAGKDPFQAPLRKKDTGKRKLLFAEEEETS